ILTFQNHTNRPLTDFGGKTSIFSHPVYLFLREFSLQDFRGGSDIRKNSARRRPVTGRSPRTGEEAQCICSYREQVRPEALS
ncbi:hypothetical protein JZM01_23860, partial [Escherichia coli]|nr:hypothetical protein [Escherichia coli]